MFSSPQRTWFDLRTHHAREDPGTPHGRGAESAESGGSESRCAEYALGRRDHGYAWSTSVAASRHRPQARSTAPSHRPPARLPHDRLPGREAIAAPRISANEDPWAAARQRLVNSKTAKTTSTCGTRGSSPLHKADRTELIMARVCTKRPTLGATVVDPRQGWSRHLAVPVAGAPRPHRRVVSPRETWTRYPRPRPSVYRTDVRTSLIRDMHVISRTCLFRTLCAGQSKWSDPSAASIEDGPVAATSYDLHGQTSHTPADNGS